MIEPAQDRTMLPRKMRALAAQVTEAFKEAETLVGVAPELREDPAYKRLCGEAAQFATGSVAAARIFNATMKREPGRQSLLDSEQDRTR